MISTGSRAFVSIACAFATVGVCADSKPAQKPQTPPASIVIAMKATNEGRPATTLFTFSPGVPVSAPRPVPIEPPERAERADRVALLEVSATAAGGIGPRVEAARKNAGGARTGATVSAIALAVTAIVMSLGAWLRRG